MLTGPPSGAADRAAPTVLMATKNVPEPWSPSLQMLLSDAVTAVHVIVGGGGGMAGIVGGGGSVAEIVGRDGGVCEALRTDGGVSLPRLPALPLPALPLLALPLAWLHEAIRPLAASTERRLTDFISPERRRLLCLMMMGFSNGEPLTPARCSALHHSMVSSSVSPESTHCVWLVADASWKGLLSSGRVCWAEGRAGAPESAAPATLMDPRAAALAPWPNE